jgi:hypothetical protein
MIIAMARDTSQFPDRVYMAEISSELKRDRSTIVTWDTRNWLPDGLEFHRDENGWRYWTRDQIKLIKRWMRKRNKGRSRPGKRVAGQPATD